VVLLGIVLASFARPDDVSSISEGHHPVEAVSEGLPHKGYRGSMMPKDADMDVEEQCLHVFGIDALEEYPRGTPMVQMLIYNLVALGSAN
jgi:hypothetical protein